MRTFSETGKGTFATPLLDFFLRFPYPYSKPQKRLSKKRKKNYKPRSLMCIYTQILNKIQQGELKIYKMIISYNQVDFILEWEFGLTFKK